MNEKLKTRSQKNLVKNKESVEKTDSPEKSLNKGDKYWKYAFIVLSVIILGIIVLLSLDAGNSGDEDIWQYPHAEKIYNFYVSGGKDTTYKTVPEMNFYGMWFETISVAIEKICHIDNYQTLRHIMNAFMGFIAILFAGLLAKNIKNWRAGTIVMVLLLLSPRFLGHSFNNPKDIPFAAMFMAGLYYIHKFITEYPKPKIRTCVKLAIAIGLSIAIRAGGILLYAYFGFFLLVYFLIINKPKHYFQIQHLKIAGHLLLKFILIVVAAFLITIPLCPYIMPAPIHNTMEAFSGLSHFSTALRQLFEGELQWSDMLPWYYTPKYILMTIPTAVILGVILFFCFLKQNKKTGFENFMIGFAFIFPIFWIVYSNANVYGGWRHAIFAYPPMVIAAGLGFHALIDFIQSRITKRELQKNSDFQFSTSNFQFIKVPYYLAIVLPFLLLIPPALHILRAHPYEYVYFNELAGGMKKAYGNYEMDYYFHSTREASEWIIAHATTDSVTPGKKIKVVAWHNASVQYFFRHDTARFQIGFVRWYERGNSDWDYAIFPITGIMPEQIKDTPNFPPSDCIHTINVDGFPICLILKRASRYDFIGNNYKSKNMPDSAIICFKKALCQDSLNESALMNVIETYMQHGQPDSAKPYIDRALRHWPHHETSNFFLAHYELGKQNADNALKACQDIIKDNFKFSAAYHLACNIYLRKNDIDNAEKMLIKLIDIDRIDDQCVRQLVEIYKVKDGLNEAAAYAKLYRVMAKRYEKRGKKEEAKRYRQMSKDIFSPAQR
ncbi:MAG: phospholipid carrier-dependent glycosyltransferase [Bacteroidales bacterium]|jgi:Tfp pilus assembly protein PilF|nr:phospholipid carrier-dependent glycosyltransferase [Bacteroidales bacterium]